MRKHSVAVFVTFLLSVLFYQSRSQDLIVKINGDTIKAKVNEINPEEISYKKTSMPYGPTFTERKSEIAYIKFSNGEVEVFNKTTVPAETKTTTASESIKAAQSGSTSPQEDGKNKIEMTSDGFTINGKPAKRKEVDKLLASSKNPAVVMLSKGTSVMGKTQKIMKIASYPVTISGSFLTLIKVAEGYQLVQRGRATPAAFWNMGLSLAGTMVFPITNKILKKKSNKMYGKVIDMYNVTN